MAKRWGKSRNSDRFYFLGFKITAGGDWSHEIKRHLLLVRKAMTNLESVLKSRDITLSRKAHIVKAVVFPVVMYRCESWTIKKAKHQRTILLNCDTGEDFWEDFLDCKEIKPVNPKGNQSWVFIGRTAAEAPILWPPNAKSQLTGKDWCWERLKAKREEGSRGWDG